MIHHSHVTCDDCGKKHTPGSPSECIEQLKEQLSDARAHIGSIADAYSEMPDWGQYDDIEEAIVEAIGLYVPGEGWKDGP